MSDLDRLVRAFRSSVREAVPMLGYLGFYEYRVIAQSSDRLDLQVTGRGLGLPDLVRVTVRPGLAGGKATLALGALVLVGFVNGDDKRPFVAFYDAPGSSGFAPVSSTVDASATVKVGPSASAVELAGMASEALEAGDEAGRVVRYGDPVQMFLGAALVPTTIRLMRAGTPVSLAGDPTANVSKVKA